MSLPDRKEGLPEPEPVYPADDEQFLVDQMDWTKEEEIKAKRKLDLIIMPILILGCFCLQLDRGNISNALTDNFMEDVGLNQDQFNVGQQMMSLAVFLFDIPSNMVLYRVGPGKWLTLQLFFFGIVSTFQAFQHGYGAFIGTRFLLGIAECGFIPGSLWTLSTWYTKKETAKRVMVFYLGFQVALATSKLIAFGILHMRGVGGKPGWFWLFTILGAFTVLCGFVFGFFFPDSFKNPRSTFLPNVSIFDERQIHILRTRVLLDDPAKAWKKKHIGLPAFKKTFSNWRLWIHFLITLFCIGPQTSFGTYLPSMLRSIGFPALTSNALASVGLFVHIPVSFMFSFVSDRYNMRGETVMAGLSMQVLSFVLNRVFTELRNRRGVRYLGFVWTQTIGALAHPLNVVWMSLTCTDSEERALAMAMISMGANMAGIYGAQILRADDNPLYRRGFVIDMAIIACGLTLAVGRYLDEHFHKHRRNGEAPAAMDSESDQNSQVSEKSVVSTDTKVSPNGTP